MGFYSFAQTETVSVYFTNQTTREPVIGAIIFATQDTSQDGIAYSTDVKGLIGIVIDTKKDTFYLSQENLGFKSFKHLRFLRSSEDHFHVYMEQDAVDLNTVTLNFAGSIFQKGDTTVHDAHEHHHETNESAKDIVQQLPNTEIKGNTVIIDGEEVKTVAINGQTYKGGAKTALNNVPSDIIAKIEVIDVVSPEDPSVTFKKINFITKNKQVKFGKISAKYSFEERYRIAGNKYFHKGKHRYTLMGDINNINHEDLLDHSIENLYKGDNKLIAAAGQYVYKSKKVNQETSLSGNHLTRSLIEQTVNQPNYVSVLPFSSTLDSNHAAYSIFNASSKTDLKTSQFTSLGLNLNYNFRDRGESENSFFEQYFDPENIDVQMVQNTIIANEQKISGGADYTIKIKPDSNHLPSKIVLGLDYSNHFISLKDSLDLTYNSTNEKWATQTNEWFTDLKFNADYNGYRKKGMRYFNIKSYYWLNNQENFAQELVAGQFLERVIPSQDFVFNQSIHSFQVGWVQKLKKAKLNLYLNESVYYQNKTQFNFLPGVVYLRNKTKKQKFKAYLGGKVNRPSFSQANPVFLKWQSLMPKVGNQEISPFVSWTGVVTFKKFNPKKYSLDSKISAVYTNDPINRVFTFLNNDSILGDIVLSKNSQLLQWENLNYQVFSNGYINYEKHIRKLKLGGRLGYIYNQTQSRINGVDYWMFLKRLNAKLFAQLKPTDLLYYKASLYANFGGSGAEFNSLNVLSYSWYFNQEVKYLLKKKILLKAESRTFQAAAMNENNIAPVTVISCSGKYLLNKDKLAIELTVHDILNQNKDVVLQPDPNVTTIQTSNLLTRYGLLGITYKF